MFSAEYLRTKFIYDSESGKLFHKTGRYAGIEAGCTHKVKKYRLVYIEGSQYMAQTVIWCMHHGEWPSKGVDHKDLDRGNNRIDNHRLATPSENSCNATKRCHNRSGFKGVHWHPQSGKWRAQIKKSGRKESLGLYDDAAMAAKAYDAAAIRLHGEFARINQT